MVAVAATLRAGRDLGRGMHPGRRARPKLLLEMRAEARQRDGRIVNEEKKLVGLRLASEVRRQQDDGSGGGHDLVFVFGIAQKGQVAGLRVGQSGNATDGLGRGAARGAGLKQGHQFGGSEGKLHAEERE